MLSPDELVAASARVLINVLASAAATVAAVTGDDAKIGTDVYKRQNMSIMMKYSNVCRSTSIFDVLLVVEMELLWYC